MHGAISTQQRSKPLPTPLTATLSTTILPLSPGVLGVSVGAASQSAALSTVTLILSSGVLDVSAIALSRIHQVQKDYAPLNGATSAPSTVLSVTFDSPPTPGNLLLMVVATSIYTTSWTIPAGWTQLIFQDATGDLTPDGSNRSLGVAYKVAASGEPSLVSSTITMGTAGQADMMIFEYSGVGVLDKSFTTFKTAALNTLVGPTAATAEADELAFSATCISNRTGQSLTNGFVRQNLDSARSIVGEKILTAVDTPSTTAAWTSATSDSSSGLFTFLPWKPNAISGLAVWLDASDFSTITYATAPNISAIADKSGNARTHSQATATNQPKSGTRSMGPYALNVLDFDGSNDFMKSTAWTLAQPFTTFVVFAFDIHATSQMIFMDRGTSGTPGGPVHQRNSIGAWESFGGTALMGPLGDTLSHVMTTIWNDNDSFLRIDGSEFGGAIGTQSFSAGGMTIGSSRTPGNYFNGVLAEVLVYSGVMSAADIVSVEAYLKRKWITA